MCVSRQSRLSSSLIVTNDLFSVCGVFFCSVNDMLVRGTYGGVCRVFITKQYRWNASIIVPLALYLEPARSHLAIIITISHITFTHRLVEHQR